MKRFADICRGVKDRARRSDRNLFWYALATAFAAHVLFWGAFSYRPIHAASRESSASVMMLTNTELASIAGWLECHDPAAFNRGDFRKLASAQSIRDVKPGLAPGRPQVTTAARTYSVRKYRELPVPAPPMRAVLPVPAPPEPPAAKPKARPGRIADDRGNELKLAGVELLPRTPQTVGDTVLQVLNPGRYPTLSLKRSCGDRSLDRFALRVLLPLATSDPAPEYLIVSWPDPKPEKRK